MFHSKFAPIPVFGALVSALGFASVALAEGGSKTVDLNQVSAFVKAADLSLADAIKKAEQESNGKAIHAVMICDHGHGLGGVEHYKVCCLAQGKIIEVCVDRDNGKILGTHETTKLPIAFQVTTSEVYDSATPARIRLQRASELIGKSVENNRGEKLGEVQDLAIDPDRDGRVVYAVLSFGGFLGMGEKWFAIPIGALSLPDHTKHFVLAVEKDRLKNASGFDKDRWPKMGDTSWGTGIHEFYGQRPYWMEGSDLPTGAELRIQKASEMIGRTVQNDRGEKIGEIKDLVLDVDRSRIVYGVLSFGGIMCVGDKLFAIPTGVLQMPGTASYVVLSVDKEQLKSASGFDKNHWPNMADPTLVTTTYEFYGQRPYWVEDSRRTSRSRP